MKVASDLYSIFIYIYKIGGYPQMVDAVIRGQAENDVKEVSPDDPMSVSKYGDDFYDQRDRKALRFHVRQGGGKTEREL